MVTAVALVAGGCGDSGSDDGRAAHEVRLAAASATDYVELRTTLISAFQAQTYLQCAADRDVERRKASQPAGAITAALDANGRRLVDAVAAGYGEAAADVFSEAWNGYQDRLSRFLGARGDGDLATFRKARDRFGRSPARLARVLGGDRVGLPQEAIGEALSLWVGAFLAAVVYLDQPSATERVTRAASFGKHLAGLIAEGSPAEAAASDPHDGPGPAQLRPALTAHLEEHAYLAAVAGEHAADARPGQFDRSVLVLSANGTTLTQAVEAAYGTEVAQTFGELWSRRTESLVDYARAVTADRSARFDPQEARALASEQAALFASVAPEVDEAALSGALGDSAVATAESIRLAVTDQGAAVNAVTEAAASLRDVARSLADGTRSS
ncbi:MAG: hypothetical protein ACRDY7_03535 [Acidimicrobiia bacterium]